MKLGWVLLALGQGETFDRAAWEEITQPIPGWLLGEMPDVRVEAARHTASAEEAERIRECIDRLVEVGSPLHGVSSTMAGTAFYPLPDTSRSGALLLGIDHGLREPEALTRLVALGPKALPFLLDALDDARPTELVVRHERGFGAMWYGLEAQRSTASPAETRAAAAHPGICEHDSRSDQSFRCHAVTVGDLCFVAIGQITNRDYEAVRYQPTGCTVVNSPTAQPKLASYVRAVWGDADPATELARRLLADFYTGGRGTAEIVGGAEMRLLFYYPDEAAPIVCRRLAALLPAPGDSPEEGGLGLLGDELAQYPRTLLRGLRHCNRADVAEAALAVMRRTDEPYLIAAGMTERVARDHRDEVHALALRALRTAPEREAPFGGHYHLLERSLAVLDDPRDLFEAVLAHDLVGPRRSVVHALGGAEEPVSWAVDLLEPLLEDRTTFGWSYAVEDRRDSPRERIRICDEAAQAICRHLDGATFVQEGTHADLDRQIEALQRTIAASRAGSEER